MCGGHRGIFWFMGDTGIWNSLLESPESGDSESVIKSTIFLPQSQIFAVKVGAYTQLPFVEGLGELN